MFWRGGFLSRRFLSGGLCLGGFVWGDFVLEPCFRCINKGHQAKECRSRSNCQRCEGNHHQSIYATEKSNKSEHQVSMLGQMQKWEKKWFRKLTFSTVKPRLHRLKSYLQVSKFDPGASGTTNQSSNCQSNKC